MHGIHLSALRIQNFRNFIELHVTDMPGSLVVVGENGVGKTNVLHALRLALDPALPESARWLRSTDFHDSLPEPFGGGAEIRIEVELAGFSGDATAMALLRDALVPGTGGEGVRGRITYVFRPRVTPLGGSADSAIKRKPGAPLGPDDFEAFTFIGDDESRRAVTDIRRYAGVRVFGALRDAADDLRGWRRSPLAPLLESAGVPEATLSLAAGEIEKAQRRITTGPELTKLSVDITARLNHLLGGRTGLQATLGLDGSDASLLLRSIRLSLGVGRHRPVGENSLGVANVVYFTLLLEHLQRQRAARQLAGEMLAIEEPEAHLHPQLQRVLFRALLREQPGMIVTTHSPHLASVTPLTSLVVLRATSAGTAAFTIGPAGLSDAEVRDLERYLDVTRAELVFARGVILVEGPTEQYLVPATARLMGHDLDAYGISVLNVHGTDFGPFHRLMSADALNIPHVVITDGDTPANARGVTHAGLRRAIGLLPAAQRKHASKLRDAVVDNQDAGAEKELRDLCTAAGIFIGEDTFEIDLLPAARDPLVAAYQDLLSSTAKRHLFPADVDAFLGATEADVREKTRKKILSRIENRGKGRVAQRLAERLTDSALLPSYLTDAVERIITMVAPCDADPSAAGITVG
ncbi:AAA family ATPase [Micromonospora chalcea]|uniref:ATP-dependent nuclease n=1 Tax=Micromonospora chalcea TaxID=1874 RepID=UPI0033F10101